jgi:ubiquinone/menaquinone biosynthesis C-methylase UbiE
VASFDPSVVRRSYESVAEEYVVAFAEDLKRLPLDCEVLDDVARVASPDGPIVDVGCGPGHVAAYLSERHRAVIGLDLAPRVLFVARRRQPELSFVAGDIRRLPLHDGSCSGAVAFYSLQHIPRASLPAALAEIGRVMARGAALAIAAHDGEGELSSPTDWMGHQVESMAVTLYTSDELQEVLTGSTFSIKAIRYRDPLPHEYQGRRIYVTATRSV